MSTFSKQNFEIFSWSLSDFDLLYTERTIGRQNIGTQLRERIVGPVRAKNIIEWRQENSLFKNRTKSNMKNTY